MSIALIPISIFDDKNINDNYYYCVRSEMVIAVRYLLGKNRMILIDFELKKMACNLNCINYAFDLHGSARTSDTQFSASN